MARAALIGTATPSTVPGRHHGGTGGDAELDDKAGISPPGSTPRRAGSRDHSETWSSARPAGGQASDRARGDRPGPRAGHTAGHCSGVTDAAIGHSTGGRPWVPPGGGPRPWCPPSEPQGSGARETADPAAAPPALLAAWAAMASAAGATRIEARWSGSMIVGMPVPRPGDSTGGWSDRAVPQHRGAGRARPSPPSEDVGVTPSLT